MEWLFGCAATSSEYPTRRGLALRKHTTHFAPEIIGKVAEAEFQIQNKLLNEKEKSWEKGGGKFPNRPSPTSTVRLALRKPRMCPLNGLEKEVELTSLFCRAALFFSPLCHTHPRACARVLEPYPLRPVSVRVVPAPQLVPTSNLRGNAGARGTQAWVPDRPTASSLLLLMREKKNQVLVLEKSAHSSILWIREFRGNRIRR